MNYSLDLIATLMLNLLKIAIFAKKQISKRSLVELMARALLKLFLDYLQLLKIDI